MQRLKTRAVSFVTALLLVFTLLPLLPDGMMTAEAAEIPTPAVIEEEREEIADFSRRPSRESVMKSISDTSTTKSNEEVEDRIRQMYKAGKSVIDISKELNIGQGEVKLMIALLKKRS